VGLVISFIPALHEVANFSWFIGVFLGGVTYRWLAREDREAATARNLTPAWRRKRVILSPGRRPSAAFLKLAPFLLVLMTPLRKQ
jgi:hypothetical protein